MKQLVHVNKLFLHLVLNKNCSFSAGPGGAGGGDVSACTWGQFLEAQPWPGPVLEAKALLPVRQSCEMLLFSSL